jgi:hypothetical protein
MTTSPAAGTIDFTVADEQQSALEATKHHEARVDFDSLTRDNSYRPWNSNFEDPATPLDLPPE